MEESGVYTSHTHRFTLKAAHVPTSVQQLSHSWRGKKRFFIPFNVAYTHSGMVMMAVLRARADPGVAGSDAPRVCVERLAVEVEVVWRWRWCGDGVEVGVKVVWRWLEAFLEDAVGG